MRKLVTCFVFLFLAVLLLFIIKPDRAQPVSITEQNNYGRPITKKLDQLVRMENDAAKNSTSSQTSKENTDYTKMFPELYTEYIQPRKMDYNKKIAYLTFDDGPSENTYKILDILQEANVKATFFIVGSSIKEDEEESLTRMVNEGHTIGIHTYSHMCNEIYCSVERFLDDFNKVYQQIYEITGERVSVYRFPWGSKNKYSRNIKGALMDEMERRGFTCYDWNVSAEDSVGRPTRNSIRRNIRKDLLRLDYPIILMHDSGINDLTVEMLPDIIKMISDEGYEFDSLDNRVPYQFP